MILVYYVVKCHFLFSKYIAENIFSININMNKVVLVIILVGVFAIVTGFFVDLGLKVYKTKNEQENAKFPPWPATCPDYWQNMGDNVCRNVHKIGDCKSGEVDNDMSFDEEIFKNARGQYYKCNWSKQCRAPWEGIDNLC